MNDHNNNNHNHDGNNNNHNDVAEVFFTLDCGKVSVGIKAEQ